MSIINRVLQDLDRHAGQSPLLVPGVRSVVPPASSRWPLWAGFAGGLAIVVSAIWGFWPDNAATTPSGGKGTASAERPTPTAPRQTLPVLRMSEALETQPPRPVNVPENSPKPPAPLKAQPTVPPAPKAVSMRVATRLSEIMSPVQAPVVAPEPLVVKASKPQTPAEQAEEIWHQASRLVEQGRSQHAQALMEQVLQLDPSHMSARQNMVMLALEGGNIAAAEALLRQGMNLHPDAAWFSRSLAQLRIRQGDHAQAASILKGVLGKHSEAQDWGLYAATLASLGRSEDAAAAYREALSRDASQGTWWIGLGLALEQTGQTDLARNAFNQALQARLSQELKEFAERKAQNP